MGSIGRRFAHHGQVRLPNWTRARVAATLLVLATAAFAAALAPAAKAGSLPAVIAYEGAGGIGTVQPGNVHSARVFYAPTSGGTDFPAWSPNGETMAAGVNTPHGLGIAVVDRSSGKVIDAVQLPNLEGPADLDWSPDGKEIAYLCLDPPVLTTPSASPFVPASRYFNVCVLDVLTGVHRLLAVSTLGEGLPLTGSIISSAQRISWSPSGDVIAVGGERDIASGNCTGLACGQPNIALVDVATGAMTALDGTDNYADPAFSRNGSEIASTNVASRGGVYIMSASGGDVRRIVSPADGGSEPNWSPNGKELAFQGSSGDLFTVDSQGGDVKQTTDAVAGDPSWVGPITRCTVPKLKGQTLAAAKRLVALAGCVVGKVTGPKKNRSKLRVVNQKPAANKDVDIGTKVNIQIR
jgi:Tol biopolymer transport system component